MFAVYTSLWRSAEKARCGAPHYVRGRRKYLCCKIHLHRGPWAANLLFALFLFLSLSTPQFQCFTAGEFLKCHPLHDVRHPLRDCSELQPTCLAKELMLVTLKWLFNGSSCLRRLCSVNCFLLFVAQVHVARDL